MPQGLTATPGNGSVNLSWQAPADNGGSPISDYIVQWSANGPSNWVTVNDGISTVDTCNGDGVDQRHALLHPGPRRERSRSRSGQHRSSALPGPFRVRHNVDRGPRCFRSDQAGVVGPDIDGRCCDHDYIIQRSANGTTGWTTINDGVAPTTGYTVTGLTNGTRYYFRVLASNAAGNSGAPTTSPTHSPELRPSPRTLTAVPTNLSGQIRLSWLLPASNGGSAITDYIIQRSPNGTIGWPTINDGVRTTTSYTVTGLTNGTRYYFRVLAKNAAGNSACVEHRQRHPAHRADRPAHVDRCPDQRLGSGATVVAAPRLQRRRGDHRLHHPTLTERHDGMG